MYAINRDALRQEQVRDSIETAVEFEKAAMSPMFLATTEQDQSEVELARSFILSPVMSDFTPSATVVGIVGVLLPWEDYFASFLPPQVKGIEVVISDSCGTTYTLRLNGQDVELRGKGDLHADNYNSERHSWTIGDVAGTPGAVFYVVDQCIYTFEAYPTKAFEDEYTSNTPMLYAIAVFIIFAFTMCVFLVYDWAVRLRQTKVLKTATRTQAIVTSLFPKNVQERIFKDAEEEVKNEEKTKAANRFRGNRIKDQLRTFLSDGIEDEPTAASTSLKSKPIADLFPEATVIFAE